MSLLVTFLAGAVAAAGAPRPAAPNLLLVTIDTLRADRVGAYGHAAARTPVLDELAREGVLVDDVVASVPQTRPSHASLFTGLHPFEHGLRDNVSGALAGDRPTLASLLRAAGYDTAGFIAAYPVARPSGLDRGFAVFDDPFGGHQGATTRSGSSERRATEVVDAALGWLEHPRDAPFFLWVHLFDPHAPYEPPQPFARRFAGSPYDGEVAYCDAELGRLLGALEVRGLADHTLVVVTSDHGEGLGDHAEDEHMLLVYDSTLRVPLILRWPGRLPAGARIAGQFRSVDLLPTLLELLGRSPVAASGVSRARQLLTGGSIPDNEAYAESLYGEAHYGWAPLRTLRSRGWKYIAAPRAELYDLRADPGETQNRLHDRAETAEAMRRRLESYDSGSAPPATPGIDVGTAERLAALGYVAEGFSGERPSGADPKDKLEEFGAYQRGMREGIRRYRSGDLEGAVRLLTRLEQGELASFNVTYHLGRSLLRLGRFEEALPRFEEALALAPEASPVYVSLADAQRGAGRLDAAAATLARGLENAPRNAELLFAQGQLLKSQGRDEPALAALEQARALEPEDHGVRAALADLYRKAGRIAAARREAETAVRLAPDWVDGHIMLGLAQGAAGQEDEAAQSFREALRLDPDHPDALFFLAAVEVRAGRSAEALPLLQRLREQAPDYPGAEELRRQAQVRAGSFSDGIGVVRLLLFGDPQQAEAARGRLVAGASLAAVMRELSEDPTTVARDLGQVGLADLAPPLRAAVVGLEAGETSPVIEGPDGFLIAVRER